MLLLDFDNSVLRYEVQPVKIPVPGVPRGYVPDILVHFKPDPTTSCCRRPLLAEVKPSEYLKKYHEKYKPKFDAADLFANERGWEFIKVTEVDIHTPRLANLKFLREYRNIEPSNEDLSRLQDAFFSAGGEASADQVLQTLAATDNERLHWLPIIWYSVVSGFLASDLDKPLTHHSMLFHA